MPLGACAWGLAMTADVREKLLELEGAIRRSGPRPSGSPTLWTLSQGCRGEPRGAQEFQHRDDPCHPGIWAPAARPVVRSGRDRQNFRLDGEEPDSPAPRTGGGGKRGPRKDRAQAGMAHARAALLGRGRGWAEICWLGLNRFGGGARPGMESRLSRLRSTSARKQRWLVSDYVIVFGPLRASAPPPGLRGTRGGVASCSNHSSSAGEGGLAIGRTKANASQTVSGRTLNNAGAATLASQSPGYGLSVSDGATLNNASGASFTFIADASIQDGGGTPRGGRSTTTAPWSRPAGAVPAPSASP